MVVRGDKSADSRDTLILRVQPEEEAPDLRLRSSSQGRRENSEECSLRDNQEVPHSGVTVPQAHASQRNWAYCDHTPDYVFWFTLFAGQFPFGLRKCNRRLFLLCWNKVDQVILDRGPLNSGLYVNKTFDYFSTLTLTDVNSREFLVSLFGPNWWQLLGSNLWTDWEMLQRMAV